VPLSATDKINPGRFVHLQDAGNHCARAKLIVRKAKPAAFAGELVLSAIGNRVQIFADEVAATGQTATNLPQTLANGDIPNTGSVFWVQGATVSGALRDTGFTLAVKDVEPDGDKVTVTVVQAVLEIYKSRPAPTTNPAVLSATDKLNPGRFVQVQNPGNHCGRAKLIVRKAKPVAFTGELVLTATDNKVQLFAAEVAAGGQVATVLPKTLANGDIPDTGSVFWVQGATVSGALRDTGFKLDVKDVEPNADKVAVTVANFTRIQATIESTPPNTARPGIALPLDHVFRSTHVDQDFTNNPPLVLMRNAQPDNALEVTVAPANLPLRWQAIRNPNDHVDLGAATDIPTVTQDSTDLNKAELDTDEKGSFRIRCYIDCNGNNQYNDGEPSIPLNLILADVEVDSDNTAGRNGNLKAQGVNGGVNVENGVWSASWAAATAVGGAGITMELVVDVTGGGANGRLGLDKVFGGLINNLTGNDIELTYSDTTGLVPVEYTIRNLYATNLPQATGAYVGDPMFRSADPAPAVITWPVLDTGRGGGGTGGLTATMSSSGPWDPPQTNQTVGKRYTLRCIDSPARGFYRQHPDRPNALLSNIDYLQQFSAYFCFWTNVTGVRGQSGDPADRVYSVVRKMDWEATGEWTVNSTNAVPVLTNSSTHQINISNSQNVDPIERAQDNGIEVRPPSGISSAIAWVTT
jgi:hypothetical protein